MSSELLLLLTPEDESKRIFVSEWFTGLPGVSGTNQIKLPLEASGTYDFDVEWGDGTSDTITAWNQLEVTHTYPATGIYRVKITGTIKGFSFNNTDDYQKFILVDSWGPLELGPTGNNFKGSQFLTIRANDAPSLPSGTSLEGSFSGIANITGYINGWSVGEVTNFDQCFLGLTNLNQDVSGWDMSNATNIKNMFAFCTNFNQNLNEWDTSSVTGDGFSGAFQNCTAFDQPLNNWNISQATDLSAMLTNTAFNQDLSSWDVSNVQNFSSLFTGSNFNQDISGWNMSSATNLRSMFQNTNFNQPVNSWDVSNVLDMGLLFTNTPFNYPLNSWDVSSVTDMDTMFSVISGGAFDQDLSSWNISNVTNLTNFMNGQQLSTGNYDALLIAWDVLTVQSGLSVSFGSSQYSAGAAATARGNLVTNDLWVITDGGQVP